MLPTWPKVIVGGFTLGTTLVAATWAVTSATWQDRVEALQQSLTTLQEAQKLTLPSALQDLTTLNAEIRDNLKQIHMYEDISKENARLKNTMQEKDSKIAVLQEQITNTTKSSHQAVETAQAKVTELNNVILQKDAYITSLFTEDEQVTIEPGNTKLIAGLGVALGVVDIEPNDVKIIFNNEEHTIKSGMCVSNGKCNAYLTKMVWAGGPQQATFRFLCSAKVDNLQPCQASKAR